MGGPCSLGWEEIEAETLEGGGFERDGRALAGTNGTEPENFSRPMWESPGLTPCHR
jgi:hypothetical protein